MVQSDPRAAPPPGSAKALGRAMRAGPWGSVRSPAGRVGSPGQEAEEVLGSGQWGAKKA